MSKRTLSSRSVWATTTRGVYAIDTSHLSARAVAEYRDFVATIYGTHVTIRPQEAGTWSWLVIEPMRYSDIGLRVAEHFFGVPFTTTPYRS